MMKATDKMQLNVYTNRQQTMLYFGQLNLFLHSPLLDFNMIFYQPLLNVE